MADDVSRKGEIDPPEEVASEALVAEPDAEAMPETAEEPAPAPAVAVSETMSTADLQAEVERLRAENEKLATKAAPTVFWRNLGAAVALVIGVVLLFSAVSAVWLNRTIMNEDAWVATMAPLAQDAAIQDWVANKATTALFSGVDIQSYVAQALKPLPPAVQGLAVPITSAIQGYIKDAATKFVRSSQFPALWEKMNRLAHKAFIASVTQTSGGVVNNQNGVVTLDTGALIDELKSQLSARGLTFVNSVPTPANVRDITLVNSPTLGALSSAIQALNTAAYVLPWLALALLAGGVALAANRQKAVLWMGIGIVVATVLPNQLVYLGRYPFANAAMNLGQMPTEAAQNAYSIIFRNLVAANQFIAVIGLIFVLGAMIAGPSGWATALRGGLSHGIDNIGPDWDFGTVGEWIYAHRAGMRSAGLIVAVAAALVLRISTIAGLVELVVILLIWLLFVQVIGRPRPVRSEEPTVRVGPPV